MQGECLHKQGLKGCKPTHQVDFGSMVCNRGSHATQIWHSLVRFKLSVVSRMRKHH